MEDLNNLARYIEEHYEFDEKKYPELMGMSVEAKQAFAIRHLALHFSKTAGKIAAASEGADHGNEVDVESIKENLPKALINTLRLTRLVGVEGEEIAQEAKKIVF